MKSGAALHEPGHNQVERIDRSRNTLNSADAYESRTLGSSAGQNRKRHPAETVRLGRDTAAEVWLSFGRIHTGWRKTYYGQE